MIEESLLALSRLRPVFHSEADFKHALAWQLQSHYPSVDIRLEVPNGSADKRERVDMLLRSEDRTCFIELKYRTVAMEHTHGHDVFRLKNQGAQDSGRYHYIKDISRLENWVSRHRPACGYAIFLTNDPKYWTSSSDEMYHDAFKIHDGCELRGSLSFTVQAADSTLRTHPPLVLQGNYHTKWKNYSEMIAFRAAQFRYLIQEVTSENLSSPERGLHEFTR